MPSAEPRVLASLPLINSNFHIHWHSYRLKAKSEIFRPLFLSQLHRTVPVLLRSTKSVFKRGGHYSNFPIEINLVEIRNGYMNFGLQFLLSTA
jgi:CRISPR/Cas system endoribonuclease Cas6 (RAMP superfamily)